MIINKGIKKSKSLLSFHISGNGLSVDTLIFIKDSLNVDYEEKKENVVMSTNHQVCGQDTKHDEFKEMKYQTVEIKQKIKLQEDLMRPLVELNPMDRYAFTRYLGAQEIFDGFKWQQVDDRECYICRKDCYCLFFYSKSLKNSDHLKTSEKLNFDIGKMFKKQPQDEVWISI